MFQILNRIPFSGLIWAIAIAVTSPTVCIADERDDLFESKIRPVLVDVCFRCHGDSKSSGDLRVDSRDMLLKGGESGAAIVPGKPEQSLLIKAIRRDADVSAMPPEKDKALRGDQVAAFVAWIKNGAVWPTQSKKFELSRHWAFEPLRDPAVPRTQDSSTVKSSVDAFIRAKQEASGVRATAAADKRTLIRRATFDLTGLPPAPAEIAAFEADVSPNAFEKVVDRLLKSPAYGERWGRHWLDVVRYADTAGETADYPVPVAWRYRNYVIDAFNNDKPYDQFLREQIAGDVLAQSGTGNYAEQVTATGYLAISRRFGFDSENYHHLTLQDTIDTLGQSVLGLSLGCARCHDHKFDPVSMQDYYGLYGIFDSSRYAFPGSEQKQKFRAMLPLIPPSESRPQWREFESRIAALATVLEQQKQPVPAVVLRSLHDIDGDFELQAPAAGGSNGVLVPPWLYHGQIAVTTAAQSPFKNLYPRGRVGASVPTGNREYRIVQALNPQRSPENGITLHLNLDFRIADGDPKNPHRFLLENESQQAAVEILIAANSLSFKVANDVAAVVPIQSQQWQNIQLTLDMKARRASGRIGMPGKVADVASFPLLNQWNGVINRVVFTAEATTANRPQVEYDNLGLQDIPLAPVSTEFTPAKSDSASVTDTKQLQNELKKLAGIDGDFELQTKDTAPSAPWNPGPNSVVKVSPQSQSPFENVYGAGTLGIHMPNRGEYDGFGLTFGPAQPDENGRLFVSFDFRCAQQDAGGNGSWRYYIGHGPGSSAAVELFFNGQQFFRRSGSAKEPVDSISIGEWYQVQLTLDLKQKKYSAILQNNTSKKDFGGDLATGWDGIIDYSFIDSYGHIGGVRPSLDADNFAIRDTALRPFEASATKSLESGETRRTRIKELRQQLAGSLGQIEQSKQELNNLLAEGPFPLTYGMFEGTPHNVRLQKRGEPDQLGPEVPRGFIKVLGGESLPAGTIGSGRLELARWLTRKENPLPARVMVNRIWQYHFGRGLVPTPNDFGTRGQPPTHPELLDHLATRFIQFGWSIKAMHRLIMLSATYQQSAQPDSIASSTAAIVDTAGFYTAFTRRRLSAEEIRDSILFVSGELDAAPAEGHAFPSPVSWGYSQHGPFSAAYDHNKRSIYLMTQRLKRHPFLALFDGADPNTSTPVRLGTTVPTQALFFLNDPFVHQKAERWAMQLQSVDTQDKGRIESAWQRAIGRVPTDNELAEALEFLTAYRSELVAAKADNVDSRALAAYLRTLIGSNEFLHVD